MKKVINILKVITFLTLPVHGFVQNYNILKISKVSIENISQNVLNEAKEHKNMK